MKIIQPNRSSLLYRPYKYRRQNYLSITVALLVDYREGWILGTNQELWTLFNDEASLNFKAEALDLGITKKHPELLVSGYAFSEYAKNNQMVVSVKANNIYKKLFISGDRYWDGEQISQPEIFDKIPLSWEFAYGGESFADNLKGLGHFASAVRGFNSKGLQRLPNIEDPDDRIVDKKKEYEAVSFSPIAIDNIERNKLMGTYDDEWRKFDAPGFANNIDWRYFNQAPLGQILSSLSIGDQFVFTNLHPEKKELITSLPPMVVKSLLKKHDSGELLEVDLNPTTYWAFPHLEKSIILYQGDVRLSGEDPVDDFSFLAAAVEHSERPRNLAYYSENIKLPNESQENDLFDDKYLVDLEFISDKSFELYSPKDMLRKQLTRLVEGADNLEQQLKKELPEHDSAEFEEAMSNIHSRKEKLQARLHSLKDNMTVAEINEAAKLDEPEIPSSFSEACQRMREERYKNWREKSESDKAKRRKIIFPEASDIEISMAESFKALILHDMQLEESERLDLGVAEVEEMYGKFTEADSALKTPKTFSRPSYVNQFVFEESVSLNLSSLIQLDNNLAFSNQYDEFYLADEQLENKKLNTIRAANLHLDKACFRKIDFSKAAFIRCRIKNTVFEECDFSQAVLSLTHFINCRFINCVFQKTDITKTVFNGCDFNACDLTELKHVALGIYETQFEGCKLHEFAFTRLRFSDIKFNNCHFLRVIFLNCTGETLSFKACQIESLSLAGKGGIETFGIYEGSSCRMLHLGSENLFGAIYIEDSDVLQSCMREIKAQLYIRKSNLSGSDFSRSQIESSQFEESDFTQCIFTKTQLTKGVFKHNDCKYIQARSAVFNGSLFEKVSFYSADLALVETDEKNVFDQCFFEGANLYPQQQSLKNYANF